MRTLTREQKRKHDKLNNDLFYFIRAAKLTIKHKLLGMMMFFVLNQAQRYLHKRIEDQLSRIKKVRIIVLKGRQQGVSTYVGARFYHKTSRRKAKKTYILTHESDATKTLFAMVENFRDSTAGSIRPVKDEDNEKRMIFDRLKSEYQVGTAGNKSGGRSTNVDYFHGSEVAFWKNTKGVRSGVLQTVSSGKASIGTEIILESTANGMGNMFHKMCMDALAGKGEYELVFIPWYWQDEYWEEHKPPGLELNEKDITYQETYNLSIEQMYWRFNKIQELGSLHLFRQEYPATVPEAFQTSGDSLIDAESVMRARENKTKDPNARLVMGVDPARDKDRAAIVFRRGREIPHYKTINKTGNDMILVGIIANDINKHKPVKCFIDCTNSSAIYDRLVELGYGRIVVATKFSHAAFDNDMYLNKRVEMWCALGDWMKDDANIPNDDKFHTDITVVPDKIPTSSGKWKLISKEKIKEECGFSPDIGDAAALTFAEPLPTLRLPGTTVRIKKTSGLKPKRRIV